MRHFKLLNWPAVEIDEDGDLTHLVLTDAAGSISEMTVTGNASADVELDAALADGTPAPAALAISAGDPEPKE